MSSDRDDHARFVSMFAQATERQKAGLALLLSRSLSLTLRATYRTDGNERLVDANAIVQGNELLIRLLTLASTLALPEGGSRPYPGNSLLEFLEEHDRSTLENRATLRAATGEVSRLVEANGGLSELR